MIYYYTCELKPTEKSESTWGPDVRAFLFLLSLPSLEHTGGLDIDSVLEEAKWFAKFDTFHVEERFNALADKIEGIDDQTAKTEVVSKRPIKFNGVTVRALRMPEVTMIARFLIRNYDIRSQNDLTTAVYATLE